MVTIVTRAGKGSPLTNTEVDANFNNLKSGKREAYTKADVTGTSQTAVKDVKYNLKNTGARTILTLPTTPGNLDRVYFDNMTGRTDVKLVRGSGTHKIQGVQEDVDPWDLPGFWCFEFNLSDLDWRSVT